MTATHERETLGVLLMTYGSPATLDDIPAFLASTRGGRPAPDDLIAEFRRRYATIGGSPLLRITREQAAAVERELNEHAAPGERYVVGVGMRHAPPLIGDSLVELAERGARRIAAVILSPQYSPYIMGGYHRAVDAAKERLPEGTEVTVAGAWHLHPKFLRALADRVEEALARFPADARDRVPVILTSHSLPKAVVDKEPQYLEQLRETVRAIVELTALDHGPDGRPRWQFAYQSAGHTPEEWLKPDMKDLMPGLYAAGHRHVLMVPVQFLADHLEILYDIDVAARQEAEAVGLEFHRIESLNCASLFIEALAEVARETLRAPVPA
jgi:ferrochelatase